MKNKNTANPQTPSQSGSLPASQADAVALGNIITDYINKIGPFAVLGVMDVQKNYILSCFRLTPDSNIVSAP